MPYSDLMLGDTRGNLSTILDILVDSTCILFSKKDSKIPHEDVTVHAKKKDVNNCGSRN